MQQIESLEQLLPNFEQFLEDLSSIKLTSDLEKRVNTYRERIKLHVEKHSQQPGSAPPKLPDSHPPPLKRPNETDEAFLLRQRVIARETYSSSGGSAPQEDEDIYEEEDFYLEPAATSPPVPSSDRPNRVSRPPDLPPTPHENGEEDEEIYEFDVSSGPARVIDEEEEQLLYQDVEDDNYDEDFNSDSTDFEEVGEGGQVTSQLQPKLKKSKFDLFQEQFADDPQVDMIGELFYSDTSGNLSTRILNKWVKKYCVARDMHLVCHNGPNKGASNDIPLPGHRVELRARSGGKKNVLVISHPSRGDQMFSCRSKEEAKRWLEVLQDYATMGHEIEPNSGYVEEVKEEKKAKEKNKKEKKKEKKKNRTLSPPQLSKDVNGVLSGYVNLYGDYFGDPKWKKHWISIKENTFSCHLEPNGSVMFQFDLRKTSLDLAEEKRDNAALKIFSGDDTYCLVEALSMMDNGHLLKSLVAGISSGSKKDQKENKLISTLMAAFEKPKDEESEPSFYEDPAVVDGTTRPPSSPRRGFSFRKGLSVVYFQHRGPSLDKELEEEESMSANGEVVRNLRQGKARSPDSPSPKSPDEDTDEKSSPGKSNDKTGKKSAFSRLFSPKGGNASKVSSKPGEKASPSPSASPTVEHNPLPAEGETKPKADTAEAKRKPGSATKLERKISKVAPGQPDLLLASQLSEDRAEKEAVRKELNQKKKDLRLKKFSLKTDEEREQNDEELKAVQREWSKVNNELVELDKKIFMAKNGNQAAVARRTSYMSGRSAVEDGVIQASEKVTTGTVANMKSLFQGN